MRKILCLAHGFLSMGLAIDIMFYRNVAKNIGPPKKLLVIVRNSEK